MHWHKDFLLGLKSAKLLMLLKFASYEPRGKTGNATLIWATQSNGQQASFLYRWDRRKRFTLKVAEHSMQQYCKPAYFASMLDTRNELAMVSRTCCTQRQ